MPPARGSHPKLTPQVRKTLIKLIGDGNPFKTAAEAAGITERTLHRWLEEGKTAGAGPLCQLCQDIKKARAKGRAARLRQITTAGKKHWQAHAWVLERTDPANFGASRKEVRELRKQLAELLARLARLEGPRDPAQPPPQTPPGDPPPGPAGE